MLPTRDAAGKFLPGCQPGPGRPAKQVEESYAAAIKEAVTPAAWRQIVERAVADAQEGDRHARSWLTQLLGVERVVAEAPAAWPQVQIVLPDNGRETTVDAGQIGHHSS